MYIKFDENGEYGFFTPEIHGKEFCENECIEITKDFYDFLMQNNGKYLISVTSVVDTVTQENLIERPIEIVEKDTTPTLEERLQTAEDTLLFLLMGGV